jgi:uncharacterized OB-fold protein
MKINEARPISDPDHGTQAWWDATREGKFLVQRCAGCDHRQHYPRNLCTACGGTDLTYDEASGRGQIYSHTTVRRAPHPAFEAPYVVALVRLEEGPVVLSNITGVDPADVRCDMPVKLVWEDLPDGRKLPLFTGDA